MQHSYRRVAYRELCRHHFTRLAEVEYAVEGATDGATRTWEMVQRTTRTPQDYATSPVAQPVDGVEICAVLTRTEPVGTGSEVCRRQYLILVAQYRPPLDGVVLEFPAGLIDAHESAIHATLRELREETGYHAEAASATLSPTLLSPEPGLTDSCCYFVHVSVDGDLDANRDPKQQLDELEDIHVVLLPLGRTSYDALQRLKSELGPRTVIDAKLYTFLRGYAMASAPQ